MKKTTVLTQYNNFVKTRRLHDDEIIEMIHWCINNNIVAAHNVWGHDWSLVRHQVTKRIRDQIERSGLIIEGKISQMGFRNTDDAALFILAWT